MSVAGVDGAGEGREKSIKSFKDIRLDIGKRTLAPEEACVAGLCALVQ